MVRGNFWPFTGARSPSRQLPNAIRVRAIPVATSQETWETPREYRGGAAERPRNPRGHSFLFVSGYRINYSRPSRTFAVVTVSIADKNARTNPLSRAQASHLARVVFVLVQCLPQNRVTKTQSDPPSVIFLHATYAAEGPSGLRIHGQPIKA
ncbi:hypothetical protein BN1723_010989 [Verticillium longisporum]|uniref:Uncharacterized protein n=1 Tax=Verticillium longisporum TaxID=100787 RepID=A0A0G4L381_VERLO|nr:hypothetical protein BN1723_010989 [Verticillium longisporum]